MARFIVLSQDNRQFLSSVENNLKTACRKIICEIGTVFIQDVVVPYVSELMNLCAVYRKSQLNVVDRADIFIRQFSRAYLLKTRWRCDADQHPLARHCLRHACCGMYTLTAADRSRRLNNTREIIRMQPNDANDRINSMRKCSLRAATRRRSGAGRKQCKARNPSHPRRETEDWADSVAQFAEPTLLLQVRSSLLRVRPVPIWFNSYRLRCSAVLKKAQIHSKCERIRIYASSHDTCSMPVDHI